MYTGGDDCGWRKGREMLDEEGEPSGRSWAYDICLSHHSPFQPSLHLFVVSTIN